MRAIPPSLSYSERLHHAVFRLSEIHLTASRPTGRSNRLLRPAEHRKQAVGYRDGFGE